MIKLGISTIGERIVYSVSAKDLYIGLGRSMGAWSKWAEANIETDPLFRENKDWLVRSMVFNGNETRDYSVSLEFAKYLTTSVRTEKAQEYRNYFKECGSIS
jgi:anti-repressor protein